METCANCPLRLSENISPSDCQAVAELESKIFAGETALG